MDLRNPGARALIAIVAVAAATGCERGEPTDLDPRAPRVTAALTDHPWSQLARGPVPGFGGIFVDDRGTIVVSATEMESEALARVFARDWRAASQHRNAPIEFRRVQFGFDELNSWFVALHETMGNGDVVLLDADEVRNVVTVGVTGPRGTAAVLAVAERFAIPMQALGILEMEPVARQTDLDDIYRPASAGFKIRSVNQGYCTLGFNTVYQGDTVFVANSHCSTNPFSLDNSAMYQPAPYSQRVGVEVLDNAPFSGYANPPYTSPIVCNNCRYSDSQVTLYDDTISVNFGKIAKTTRVSTGSSAGSDTLASFFNIGQKQTLDDLYVGLTVDKVGWMTGWTRGTITGTCVSAMGADGVGHPCQTTASYYADGGDSGSPVFFVLAGDTVAFVGIHWGRSEGTSYLSSIETIEYDFGFSMDVVGIPYVHPLAASISGPAEVPDDEACTFDAIVSGGTPPFSYNWWGVLSGTTSSVTGTITHSGNAFLEVTDLAAAKDTAQFYVDVDSGMDGCEW